jgi:hypothetical protein
MVSNHKLLPIPANIFIKEYNFCLFKINTVHEFSAKIYMRIVPALPFASFDGAATAEL